MKFENCKNIILIVEIDLKNSNGFITNSNKSRLEYQEASLIFQGNSALILINKEGETVCDVFSLDKIIKFKIEK